MKEEPVASSSPQPYLQVAATIRKRIHSGVYRVGEWLPSERTLTQDAQVHRRVVRAAIDQMIREGLVLRSPNCRPVVAEWKAPAFIAATPHRTEEAQSTSITEPEPTNEAKQAKGTSSLLSLLKPSRFVALVMWHGGALEKGGTAQQRIFWGMNQALAQSGYQGIFLDLGEQVGSPEENAVREARHLRYALEQKLGGVIFYPYAYEANRELIIAASQQMPFCLIDRMLPGVQADYVGVQNFEGMRDATYHLIAQGHHRIAYITKSEAINPVQDRQRGYLYALNEAFSQESDEIVLTSPAFHPVPWSLFDIVFTQPHERRPTAALAFNDYEAAVVAERLSRLGLSVPRDVVLVGFDDIVRMLPSGVGLTSVAQPFEDIGREAAVALLHRMTKPASPPQHRELVTHLVVRESSQAKIQGTPIASVEVE